MKEVLAIIVLCLMGLAILSLSLSFYTYREEWGIFNEGSMQFMQLAYTFAAIAGVLGIWISILIL